MARDSSHHAPPRFRVCEEISDLAHQGRSKPYSTKLTNQTASEKQTAIPRYGNAIVIGTSLKNSDVKTPPEIRIFAAP